MHFHSFILASLLSTAAFAQSIIPSSEPACIQQCTAFTQAQAACSTDQGQAALYKSCFCQSAFLKTIQPTPANNICPNCASGDWTTIASWYNSFCGSGAAAAPAGNGQTTQTTLATTTTQAINLAGAATTTTPGGAAATTANTAYLSSDDNPANWTDASSWFRTHWQWVVMLIVLAVAFTAIGVVGTIIHKRKSRARQIGSNETAPMTSNPAVNSWAPSRHSVHDFGTPREQSPPPMPAASTVDSRRQSKRLGKSPM